ncbi:MAG TPA: aldehyde dehydrogenase family protein, partial [Chitinophagales bacterium]
MAPSVAQQIPISPNVQLAEVLRIYDLHRKNAQQVKDTTAKQRKAKLNKLKDTILEFQPKIENALFKDLRKAPVETDYAEIFAVVSEIRHVVSHLNEWMAPKEVDTPLMYLGSTSKVIFEPKGVTLVMSPWNYPFMLPLVQVISAVAAGNTAIVKPSEFSPATSALLKGLLANVFPENEVAVIEGDHTVSTELLKLKFDHIHFTGAPAIGKVIMRAAAEHLTTVTLELGGKSPAFVDETANIDAAVNKLTWGKFINLGQTCIAPDYVLVHESKKDEFISKFKTKIEKWFGADPKQSNDLARMINNKHFNRVKNLIEDAVKDGAKIEAGGVYDESQNYIAPTVLSNVSLNSKVMQEEIFGPVLPIVSFKNIDEALQIVNEKEKPLSLYI